MKFETGAPHGSFVNDKNIKKIIVYFFKLKSVTSGRFIIQFVGIYSPLEWLIAIKENLTKPRK